MTHYKKKVLKLVSEGKISKIDAKKLIDNHKITHPKTSGGKVGAFFEHLLTDMKSKLMYLFTLELPETTPKKYQTQVFELTRVQGLRLKSHNDDITLKGVVGDKTYLKVYYDKGQVSLEQKQHDYHIKYDKTQSQFVKFEVAIPKNGLKELSLYVRSGALEAQGFEVPRLNLQSLKGSMDVKEVTFETGELYANSSVVSLTKVKGQLLRVFSYSANVDIDEKNLASIKWEGKAKDGSN